MNSKERSKLKTRLSATSSRASLASQYDAQRTSPGLQKGSKTSAGMIRRSSQVTSGTKEAQKRRTTSLKPLCQRSQQRHEQFRAEFEQKVLTTNSTESEALKNRGKKPAIPRSIAGGSLPPRLPSVRRKTKTPSTTTTTRTQTFPKPSPEARYRPRSVRESAAKQAFLKQTGARSLNLSPAIGSNPFDTAFGPISPSVNPRGASCGAEYNSSKPSRRKWHNVHGGTPPAAPDVDSEQFSFPVDNRWRSPQAYNRHQTGPAAKHQYRLRSQQFQVDKIKNVNRTRSYDMTYAEVESPLALYDRSEEDFDYA